MKKTRVSRIFIAILVLSAAMGFAGASANDQKAVIIGFKEKPSQADKDLIRAHGGEVKYSYNIINAIAANLPDQAIEAFRKNPKVDYVEMDGLVYALEETVPWGIGRVHAPLVHPCYKGTGVKVAVIDTGIDYNHPDLGAGFGPGFKVAGGVDYANGDGDPMDDHGHGTHVAGTIAATDNDIGVIGVAPEVVLYAVKVLSSSGSGSVSNVVLGIEWAEENGMNIASMSIGSDFDSPTIANAVRAANASGVLLIAAAGNDGDAAGVFDTVDYPARYPEVIAVAATDSFNNRAMWSPSSGSSTGPKVELAAPGLGVYSTYPVLRGEYATMSGTSMATPHVTGVAALIFNSNEIAWAADGYTNGDGRWTNTEVRTVLDRTATDLGAAGRDSWSGFGLVDALRAAPPACDGTPPAEVSGVAITTISHNELYLSWTANTETDLLRYKVYRGTVAGFTPDASNLRASPTTNYLTDTGLAASTTYYYKVAAVDTSGNEGPASSEVSGTTSAAPVNTMHIGSIAMSKTTYKAKSGWFTYATASITVLDGNNNPVSGAILSGHWSGLTNDIDTGSTGSDGRIALRSNSVKNPAGPFTFNVDSVRKDGWTYVSGTISGST